MKGKLEGRNALVTGGAQGMGKAIASRFAEEGASLFICDINEDVLKKTAAKIKQFGKKVVTGIADVSDRKSVQEMARQAFKEYGDIDILVNNAGTRTKPSLFIDYSPEEFDRVIKVNLYSVFHVTQAFLPAMMDRQKGKVINIASTFGKWGTRNLSGYNTSKHAVVGLTRSIALEVAPYGINVNAICPGAVDTEMLASSYRDQSTLLGVTEEDVRKKYLSHVPLGRLIQPEEIANLAVYLASDDSDGMTAQSISLCGGYIMV